MRTFEKSGILVPQRVFLLPSQTGELILLLLSLLGCLILFHLISLSGHGLLFALRRRLPLRQRLSTQSLRISHLWVTCLRQLNIIDPNRSVTCESYCVFIW